MAFPAAGEPVPEPQPGRPDTDLGRLRLDSWRHRHFRGCECQPGPVTDAMREAKGTHNVRVGGYQVELPQGITVADWGLERVRVQNPSIRSYLGCIRLLEEVLDSNYAILHCSPERLLKIWR